MLFLAHPSSPFFGNGNSLRPRTFLFLIPIPLIISIFIYNLDTISMHKRRVLNSILFFVIGGGGIVLVYAILILMFVIWANLGGTM